VRCAAEHAAGAGDACFDVLFEITDVDECSPSAPRGWAHACDRSVARLFRRRPTS